MPAIRYMRNFFSQKLGHQVEEFPEPFFPNPQVLLFKINDLFNISEPPPIIDDIKISIWVSL